MAQLEIETSDLIDMQQAAIANFYNTDRKEYWQGQIDIIQQLIDKLKP